MDNPFKIFDELRNAYLRYLDSPFRLRYQALLEERRRLLGADRQLYREPLFEPVAPYVSSGLTLAQACVRIGVGRDAADFAASGLFPARRLLYRHQLDALEATRAGRAVVVTSGTGSGKTECFLIPILAALLEESARGWGAVGPLNPNRYWWNVRGQGRVGQREHEPPERHPAVRALLLYPLNALVEDQLGRIREACDSQQARQWLDRWRGGHRFWFGRYTSATPVSGPETPDRRRELRKRLRRLQADWARAQASAAAKGEPKILSYFQDPAASEMWSRWDMQESPPDILVTNYSMLNIMLMRDVEGDIFESTRRWLQDRRNVFHLVVDELHTYRGTPGTEVGYLLRVFLDRIGLSPDSPQLRIISTSASINQNDPASVTYLEQFFGRDPATFAVIPGYQSSFSTGAGRLADQAAALAALDRDLDTPDATAAVEGLVVRLGAATSSTDPRRALAEVLEYIGAFEAVQQAGATRPFTLIELAAALFGSDEEPGLSAARGLVRAMVLARQQDNEGRDVAPLPFRVHYFFHNAGRLWVCVNPSCNGRTGTTPAGAQAPPVGRLYPEPRPRCDSCGARVLELLYCQPCGEVFIGGYWKEDSNAPNAWYLSPDYPNLDRVPDRSASLERTSGEYLVFWPASGRQLIKANSGARWTWQEQGQRGFQWSPAVLEHVEGRVAKRPGRGQAQATAGYVFEAPDPDVNAFPSKCPNCGADWAMRRVGSPIRDLGSGFQRVVQLLCDALMREMPAGPSRKLVLFSDSRQDAAKLSTGIKLSHYLDTVRQIAFQQLRTQAERLDAAYQRALAEYQLAVELLELERRRDKGRLTEEERTRRQEILSRLPAEAAGGIFSYAASGGRLPPVPTVPSAPTGYSAVSFRDLLDSVRVRLLAIGMNPGGPLPSVTEYQPRRNAPVVRWTELFDWDAQPRAYRSNLQPVERILMGDIEAALKQAVIEDVLFADGSRDSESLGLGFLWINQIGPTSAAEQAAASVIRMLGQRRRWIGSDVDGQQQAPSYVDALIAEASRRPGSQTLAQDVQTILSSVVGQWWMIDPDRLLMVASLPNAAGDVDEYTCTRCGRDHLHASAGTCTSCRAALPAARQRRVVGEPADYYEYLARVPEPPFRVNSEELTGQTDRNARLLRQRRFQDVFMEDEIADATGVDLLSVTTTMEAGVDIGALQGIGLANMPPVRFNYQQRVGRAGRRGLGMSAALTLCRGRSHDDYYFERPQLITADPPPRPYVDVSAPEIARRVVAKEVLRQAFRGIAVPYSGENVHGEFGTVGDWGPIHRPAVDAWIAANAGAIERICRAVLRRTALDNASGFRDMTDYVRTSLLRAIDDVANRPDSLPFVALSERLASLGVLPMFGFPTRVRYLFHRSPARDGGWPPERGVIDREIEIAISQFAPGAQTVKDDRLHTAVGVVDYRPTRGSVAAAPAPLARLVPVGVCRRCQALVDQPQTGGGCPYCSAARGADGYRITNLAEPPGFSTWFAISERAEFTGGFEFTPRALRARIGGTGTIARPRRNFTAGATRGVVYHINDNDGQDFQFKKVSGQEVWITEDAFARALLDLPASGRSSIRPPQCDDPPLACALAAIASTDVLTAGLNEVPVGLSLNPAVPEARAAWYSFGFLVRRAAAVRLDVAEDELDLGIQPVLDFSSPFSPPSARVFISDSLENGAGYSSRLGRAAEFEELISFMLGLLTGADAARSAAFFAPFVGSAHEEACASSCYRCLREYGNMAYHPLLDWRLALDMARLALDPDAQVDLAYGYWASLVARVAGRFFAGLGLAETQLGGLPAGVNNVTNEAVLLTHPLWDRDTRNLRPELAAAFAAAERRGLRPVPYSVFRAVRFPYEYKAD
jgi:DEAD/DEAH box helicase domain-containing protein